MRYYYIESIDKEFLAKMKVAKSYKIIFLIVAFLLSMACALGFMNVSMASAATAKPETYFILNGATASFEDDGFNVVAQEGKKISFKNDLIINDMNLKMKLPENFTTAFVLDLDSYYTNGNPKQWSKHDSEGTTFETTIKNIVELSYVSDTEIACSINGVSISDLTLDNGYLTLKLRVKDNYLTVGETDIESLYDTDEKIYYKLKNVDDRIVVKGLTFDFHTETQNAEGAFVLESVDQKSSDTTGDYKQSLVLAEGQTSLTPAKPRAIINEDFYIRNANGSYSAIKKAYTNEKYKLTIKSCSVLGGYTNLCLVDSNTASGAEYDNVLLESGTTLPNELRFKSADTNVKFAVGEVKKDGNDVRTTYVYEEFNVAKVESSEYVDETKPDYNISDEIAYASFLNAVEKATTVEKEDGTITSVGLGTDFKLPSMKDLVSDNFVVYENLSAKLYYRTLADKQSTSTNSFKLNHIGKYIFFVTFSDGENEIKEKDFFVEESDGTINKGKYFENFVFEFEIIDNADIEVDAPEIQGNGYKGVQYKASSFIVDAQGCTMKYQLYYNADLDAESSDAGWVEIPKADIVSNENYNVGGFDYDEVKKVAYDGELTFVPTRIGAYRIVCTATSSVSERDARDETIIIVESSPKVVEVPSKWLENNLRSVIFLSIGTLCLIGIVVLLFVKPKEKTQE